jgi:hypothetical protein
MQFALLIIPAACLALIIGALIYIVGGIGALIDPNHFERIARDAEDGFGVKRTKKNMNYNPVWAKLVRNAAWSDLLFGLFVFAFGVYLLYKFNVFLYLNF